MTGVARLHPLLVRARAAARYHRESEESVAAALRDVHLTTARCLVLEALMRNPSGMSLHQLSIFLGVHRTSASAAIEGLLGMGLVEKSVNPDDRRQASLLLLPAGRQRLLTARRLLAEADPA